MTRTFAFLAGLFFVALLGLFFIGFSSNTPGLLIMSILCAMPLFCLFLGAALGRASNELMITRKQAPAVNTTRVQRVERRVPESLR